MGLLIFAVDKDGHMIDFLLTIGTLLRLFDTKTYSPEYSKKELDNP